MTKVIFMVWFLVAQLFPKLIFLIQIGRMSESDKDLEIKNFTLSAWHR